MLIMMLLKSMMRISMRKILHLMMLSKLLGMRMRMGMILLELMVMDQMIIVILYVKFLMVMTLTLQHNRFGLLCHRRE